MILAEGARLKEQGEKGLEILPGAQTLLDSVSVAATEGRIELMIMGLQIPQDAWTIVTSGKSLFPFALGGLN